MASVSATSCFSSKRLAAAAAAFSLAALPALAQSTSAPTLQPVAFSSSATAQSAYAGQDIDGRSLASAPDGTIKTVAPQYGGGYGGGYHRYSDNSRWSHLAFEIGGGFTAPVGNDTSGGLTTWIGDGYNHPVETYGGNILIGAGWAFTKRFTLLGEYQWDSNKIPGSSLTAVYNGDAAYFETNGIYNIGGHVRTQSVTAEPMFYYYNSDKHTYAGYIIGGGGYYHKTLAFTAPVEEESYYGGVYVANESFASYSDNALGANFGTGVSFKPFGSESRAKLFAEARYVWVDTPSESQADLANNNVLHTGTEELIPITVGIRF